MNSKYTDRKAVIIGIFIVFGIIFTLQLFFIQVINTEYKLSADNNVIRYMIDYPDRGLIYDRDGELLVYNEAAYDLMVIPNQVKDLDTLSFCNILEITKEEFIEKRNKIWTYSRHKPSPFVEQISAEQYGKIQEKLHNFTGFYIQNRTLRKYPGKNSGQLLGYIGEVSQSFIEKNPSYIRGEYVGISGIEKTYEDELKGKKGVKIVLVDVLNRTKGSYKNGKYDTASVAGAKLTSSISKELQDYGELLMKNKKGSIVAIEPETGEVLVLVTSPGYDPNILVGRKRSKNYQMLAADKNLPLFNRALQAAYPPGSTFKLINALVGLEVGVTKEETRYGCAMGFHARGVKVGCHSHPSPLDLKQSVQHSCNAYYCNVYKAIIDNYPTSAEGFGEWRNYVTSFGFGSRLGIDLPNEVSANIPSEKYYNKYYGKGRWNALTTISLAIGQGEVLTTPLQLANQMAIIANRGYYYTPHVIKAINDKPNARYLDKKIIPIKKEHFELVIDGMEMVVNAGTARVAKLDSITMCGKTGTAQNPHGKDHSVFVAFSPKENPKIAISVFVENSGFGATWAAPIASLIIEKYLTGKIKRPALEERMMKGNLIHSATE